MANKFCKPALGTGLNDGSSWANAWQDFQTAKDNAVAGDDVFCQGTDTLTVTVDDDTNIGAAGNFIRWWAVNTDESATPMDDVDGTMFTLDGNSAATNCVLHTGARGFQLYVNFEFTGATGNGYDVGTTENVGLTFWGCKFNSNGGFGFDGNGRIAAGLLLQCQFNNNTSHGAFIYDECLVLLCEAIGNGGAGFDNDGGNQGIEILCVSHNNGTFGMGQANSGRSLFNTLDGNTSHGLQADSQVVGDYGIALFNRLTNNGGYGIGAGAATDDLIHGLNAFYNNTSGEIDTLSELALGENTSMAADGYTARASDDFSLTSIAELRRVLTCIGARTTQTTDAYITTGAPPDDTGGGGGGGPQVGPFELGAWR